MTTAVVAGTATAVSGRVARRQQAHAQQAAYDAAPEPSVAPTPPPAPAPSGGLSSGAIDRLKELAALHQQGVLTDAEFAVEKAEILAS